MRSPTSSECTAMRRAAAATERSWRTLIGRAGRRKLLSALSALIAYWIQQKRMDGTAETKLADPQNLTLAGVCAPAVRSRSRVLLLA